MMKVLVIADRYPMPAPNGLYVPVEAFVKALKTYPDVSIDLCVMQDSKVTDEIVDEGGVFFNVIKLHLQPRGMLRRFFEEVLLIRPAYMAMIKDMSPLSKQYDIVFAATDGFSRTLMTYKKEINSRALTVLCINEPCHTIQIGQVLNLMPAWYRHPLRISAFCMRSWLLRRHEQSYLSLMDVVTVQTANEIARVEKLLTGKSECKTMIYTNPIIENLLQHRVEASSNIVLIHAPRSVDEVRWFVEKVWNVLRESHANIRLRICIGALTSEWTVFNKAQGVDVIGYQEDILDVYRDVFAAIVLTRQRFGLVNRVKEAMSAGVPVVGYAETLYTLGDVQHGTHVMMASNSDEYLRHLHMLARDRENAKSIGSNARKYIIDNERHGPHALIPQLFEAAANVAATAKPINVPVPLHHRLLSLSYPFARTARSVAEFLMPERRNRLRVLLYHDIAPHEKELFATQLRRLQQRWRFVSPELFGAMVRGEAPIEGPNLLLTFDDGFASNKIVADEVLSPLGIQALFFVVPDFVAIDNDDKAKRYIAKHIYPGADAESLPRHWTNMTWGDLDELLKLGHSIGTHTQSHARLSTLTNPADLEREIVGSADVIERYLGISVKHFAFGFGNIDSFSSAAFACAQRRFRFIHSGVRGNNIANDGSFPMLYRDSLSPQLSPFAVEAILDGAIDLWYAKDRQTVNQWISSTQKLSPA